MIRKYSPGTVLRGEQVMHMVKQSWLRGHLTLKALDRGTRYYQKWRFGKKSRRLRRVIHDWMLWVFDGRKR